MRNQYSLTNALMQSEYQLDQPATLTELALTKYVITPRSLLSDSDADFIVCGLSAAGWTFVDAAVNIQQENGEWCLSSAMPAEIGNPDVLLKRPTRQRAKKEVAVAKPKRVRKPRVVPRRSVADQARAVDEASQRDRHPNIGHVASDPSRFTCTGVVMSNAQLIGMGPKVTRETRAAIRTLLTYPVDDMIEMLRENALPDSTASGRSVFPRITGSGRIM